METRTIEITIEEYRELNVLKGRVLAFADYVKNENYNISRKECAALLGFDLEVNDAGTDSE